MNCMNQYIFFMSDLIVNSDQLYLRFSIRPASPSRVLYYVALDTRFGTGTQYGYGNGYTIFLKKLGYGYTSI